MNKRIENILKRIEKNGGNRITLRRDTLVKMAQEKLFTSKSYYSYDETFGESRGEVKGNDFIKECMSCADSGVGFCYVSLKDNRLKFDCYIHSNSFFDLYIDLEVKEEKTEDKKEVEISNEDIQIKEVGKTTRIYFNGKPSEEIRIQLKTLGFRFFNNDGFYWGAYTNKIDIEEVKNVLGLNKVELHFNSDEDIQQLEVEEIENIITHTEEYTNQILKEELQELEELEKYNIVETNVNIFLNDISIARKPSNINDLKEYTELENIVINKYLTLSNIHFNMLCNDFFMDFTPIAHQGGTRGFKSGIEVDYNNYKDIYAFINDKDIEKYSDNILITNEDNTKYIVVNPEGYSYCRYVGILTVSEGTRILKQLKGEVKASNLQVIENNNCSTLEGTSNVELINSIGLEVEALEKRLNMVTSAKLKYKIQCQIDSKMKEVAKIIMSDELLYMQFMKETNQ